MTSMPIAATLPRKTRIVTYATAACFLALLVCGPLIEASLSERLFSTALLFTAVVLTAFMTRRPAFALALPTVVFGSILIASVIKYHYLATPLLAPDLIYSVNRDLLEVAMHYPPILAALTAGVILIPGLATLWMAWEKFALPVPPAPLPLSITGAGALLVNFLCAMLLVRVRHHGGSLGLAAFLSARNDVLANAAIILAGLVTNATQSIWPDLLVGLGIAAMNADAAGDVYRAAGREADARS